jgi:hypothetical protein
MSASSPQRGPDGGLPGRLARVNPTAALVVALVMLLGGFLAPGIIGGALLFAFGAGLALLTFTTWPVQNRPTRVVRLVLLTALFAVAVAKVS